MSTRTQLIYGTFTLSLLANAATIVGCGSAAPAEPPQTANNVRSAPVAARPAPAPSASQADNRGRCDATEAVYFAFDSSELDSASRDKLARIAECIRAGEQSRARVTGMADPRGTEEYNLALGDRRAQTSARYLKSLGVEQNRIDARSVGEEYASGSDETGWARDRRTDVGLQ